MPTFYRGLFTELWITLRSDEVLGILDSDYLEDYFGIDSQVTVRHENGTPYTVLMNEVTEETPSIPHDVFTGFLDLSTVPDGEYTVQGRVRDLIGNYTILNEVETPFGDERIINLTFTISSTGPPSGLIVAVGSLKLMGGLSIELKFLTDREVDITLNAGPTLNVQFLKDITLDAALLGD